MDVEQPECTCIYLDLNKWIDLARADSGREDGKKYVTVLEAADAAVTEGRVIFPLSAAHFMEVAKIGDDTQRRRLAKLMTRLSRGWFIATPAFRLVPELRRAVATELGIPLIGGEPQTAFTKSAKVAFIDPALLGDDRQFSDLVMRSPAGLEEFLARARVEQPFLDNWKVFAEQHENGRSLRWDVSRTVRKRAYCVMLTLGIHDRLEGVLREFGLERKELEKLGPERCVRLLESIPFFDVEINLHTERNEHRDRKIAPNDELDISFLSSALPCCQIVVTENFWTSLVQRLKLDRKYGTRICSDLLSIADPLVQTLQSGYQRQRSTRLFKSSTVHESPTE